MSDDSDEEKIGYKRPPRHSRWKPGQSPNPRGRTKGALNLKTEFKRVMEAPVIVNEKGKPKRVTTLTATVLRLREMALKGNVRCMALFLEHADRLGELAADAPGDISQDDQAIIDAAFRRRIVAEAAKDKSPDDDSEDKK